MQSAIYPFIFCHCIFAKKIKSKSWQERNRSKFFHTGGRLPGIRRAICLQVCYIKKLKIGAGVLYGANYVDSYDPEFYGYGAVFADALQFLGHREKWSFGAQVGHGIYNHELGYDVKLKAGMYSSISCNYRAIVSKKMLFTTSLVMGKRKFHYDQYPYIPGNSGFLGLKFGVVF